MNRQTWELGVDICIYIKPEHDSRIGHHVTLTNKLFNIPMIWGGNVMERGDHHTVEIRVCVVATRALYFREGSHPTMIEAQKKLLRSEHEALIIPHPKRNFEHIRSRDPSLRLSYDKYQVCSRKIIMLAYSFTHEGLNRTIEVTNNFLIQQLQPLPHYGRMRDLNEGVLRVYLTK